MATKTTENKQRPLLLEYIWVSPNTNIKSKTKVWHGTFTKVEDLPTWNYLSYYKENQSTFGKEFSVLLKPVAAFTDPFRGAPHLLVLAEMLTIDKNPHPKNSRAKAVEVMERAKESQPQFGIE